MLRCKTVMYIKPFKPRLWLGLGVTLILVTWAGLITHSTINEMEEVTRTATPEIRFGVWKDSRVLSMLVIMLISLILLLLYLLHAELTYHQQQAKETETLRSKMEELSKVKEHFLAHVNHEIRTPLNTILGFNSLLQNSDLSKQQKQYVKGILKSSEHLLHIVNDMLDYTRLKAGKMKLNHTSFFLPTLVEEVIQTLEPDADQEKIELRIQITPELSSLHLVSDPLRVQQILHHLLEHAIQFTSSGTVRIRCSSTAADAEGLRLLIHVEDTGSGIAPKELGRFFEGIGEADTGLQFAPGGRGLGLSICYKLSTLLQGTLEAQSVPGKGYLFTLSLPCRISSRHHPVNAPIPRATTPVNASKERKNVLIADDDELNRLLLRTLLNSPHIQVEEAENGMKALELATAKRFDLILIDVHMPELSGLALVREIRSLPDPALRSTPVIAITANVLNGDPHQYLEAGMDNFLLKPYKEGALMELIHKYLGLDPNAQQVKVPEFFSGIRTFQGKLDFNIAELHQVWQGNKPFMAKMLKTFIDNTRVNVLLLKEEGQRGNWERLGGIAHRMGPSCHKFKLYELHSLLLEIEHKALHIKDFHALPALVKQIQELSDLLLPHLESELEKLMLTPK